MKSNYDENNQESIAKFILANLPRHKQFALATANGDGTPWVVCVNLAFDGEVNFIWRSQNNTMHSKNITANPNVSVCVFSETPEVGDFGYYCRAVAHEVNEEAELKKLLAVRYAGKDVPSISEFLGDSPGRLYYAKVTEAYINDDRHIKTPVDLDVLKRLVKSDNDSK